MTSALSVSCPTCKVRRNDPCVYIWPKDANGHPVIRHDRLSEFTLAQINRAGDETKRPHTERYSKALAKEIVFKRQQRLARIREQNAAGIDREAALEANGRAIIEEHNQLVSWFKENAHIFQSI